MKKKTKKSPFSTKFINTGRNIDPELKKPKMVSDEGDEMYEGLGLTKERAKALLDEAKERMEALSKKHPDRLFNVIEALDPIFDKLTHPNELFYLAFASGFFLAGKGKKNGDMEAFAVDNNGKVVNLGENTKLLEDLLKRLKKKLDE